MSVSQESQKKPGGNTKTPGLQYQNYRYFITLPYENCCGSLLSQHLKGFCKKFTFQAERGESGFEHWQIEVSLKTKEYMHTFKNMLGFNEAHIEPTKDYFKAVAYCSKKETRIEGPYTEKSIFIETPVLGKKWQHALRDELLLTKPDYRKIIIYVDTIGGAGKTDLATWFIDNHSENTAYFPYGKVGDMAYALPDNPKYVFFDIPRVVDDRINWTGIESIKNGLIFSSKYESKLKRFNRPHVVLFTNHEIDRTTLSVDRYDVRYLSNEDIKEETD